MFAPHSTGGSTPSTRRWRASRLRQAVSSPCTKNGAMFLPSFHPSLQIEIVCELLTYCLQSTAWVQAGDVALSCAGATH